jgi:hypothetical protein
MYGRVKHQKRIIICPGHSKDHTTRTHPTGRIIDLQLEKHVLQPLMITISNIREDTGHHILLAQETGTLCTLLIAMLT